MIFVIVLLVALIGCIVLVGRYDWDSAFVGVAVSVILLSACAALWICAYLDTTDTYGELLAYQVVLREYQVAITETKDAAVLLFGADVAAASQLFSVENLQHSTNIAERIKEKRDVAVWYAETTQKYRVWLSRWVSRQFMAKPPEKLRALLGR